MVTIGLVGGNNSISTWTTTEQNKHYTWITPVLEKHHLKSVNTLGHNIAT